ncbi:MAG: G8 domain-containing protein [Pseudomonadota bacterium]
MAVRLLPGLTLAFALFSAHTAAGAAAVPLSSCTLDATRSLTIGSAAGQCGPDVVADRSFTGTSGLGFITISGGGTLTLPPQGTATLQIDTAGILVNGTLQAGSPTQPVTGQVTLNFTGSSTGSPIAKGISVMQGGSLLLYGGKGIAGKAGAASWTYLAAPAGPAALYGAGQGIGAPVAAGGATSLQLAATVDWQPGDWIVVAGTDFSPDTAEFVQIQSVNCAGTVGCAVTLNSSTPLVNYHYGGQAPDAGNAAFNDGVAQNYGVDERAEVGLVSRSIKLTATDTGTVTATVNPAWGGEIMVMGGFAKVALQGVELEKFGKGQLGSYPIHFHMAGSVAAGQVLVDSNSVHHSYNKCVTLHSTNGVTVSNNVCARAVGHLFYLEAGNETGNAFTGNLGIGAMSSQFSIAPTNTAALASFWSGDYIANGAAGIAANGYNGFNVPFTDNQDGQPVQGAYNVASGFWITNPANTYSGNSVAGCQAFGRGYWLLPAPGASTVTGTFAGNRAHGCYVGFDTAMDDGVSGAVLYTPQGPCLAGSQKGTASSCDVVATLDQLTATRNRNRGIWVRASWYALHDARIATNRDGVSLVSSGGTEGSPPGEWGLLRDAIVVGVSANNVLRFGPCPYPGQNGFGGNAGCYEGVWGNGYPLPSWNFAGMMFYDGPARLEHVRFVNFNKDIVPALTTADLTYLNYYKAAQNTIPCQNLPFVYEGDAAMGWFQSNENSYPPTQYVQQLLYDNVDFRHQVYTQNVQLTCASATATTPGTTATTTITTGNFRDGDKFTVILDRDSTLTDYISVAAGTQTVNLTPIPGAYPISLNNIPFLAGPATADECLSTGAQDAVVEKNRPTSLISPYSYATLEFSALTAPCNGLLASGANCVNNNVMVFTKDQVDYGGTLQFTDSVISAGSTFSTFHCGSPAVPGGAGTPGHACVALSGRNGNGVYEPKLVNGLGYTVGATAGMPNFVSLMYGDASLPGGISAAKPFRTRVGICYKNQGQQPPAASAITVRKGAKSFASVNGNASTLAPGFYNTLACNGLDNVMCVVSGTANCNASLCPAPPASSTGTASSVITLPAVASIAALSNAAQCPGGDCYFYDAASGMLFLNLQQKQPNAGSAASSPLGSCNGTITGTDCTPESFYSCPPGGCELYTVSVDSSYAPASASDCTPYGGAIDYTQPYPASLPRLAYASNGTAVSTTLTVTSMLPQYPHNVPNNTPANFCAANAPAQPDWPPSPGPQAVFTLGMQAGTQASVAGVPAVPGVNVVALTPGQTYTLNASQAGCTGADCAYCSCQQNFTVAADGSGYTGAGPGCCGLGTATVKGTTLQVGPGPYSCQSPSVPAPPTACFQVNLPPNVKTSIVQGTTTIPLTLSITPPVAALAQGTTYTFSATALPAANCSAGTGQSCSCQQNFTVNASGPGFTSGSNCCGLGTSGAGDVLNPGASPWGACASPGPSGGGSGGTGTFSLGLPANASASIVEGTATVKTSPAPFALKKGTTYTLKAKFKATKANPACTPGKGKTCNCEQSFTVNAAGTGFASPATPNCCALGAGGTKQTTLSIGAPAWACSK